MLKAKPLARSSWLRAFWLGGRRDGDASRRNVPAGISQAERFQRHGASVRTFPLLELNCKWFKNAKSGLFNKNWNLKDVLLPAEHLGREEGEGAGEMTGLGSVAPVCTLKHLHFQVQYQQLKIMWVNTYCPLLWC